MENFGIYIAYYSGLLSNCCLLYLSVNEYKYMKTELNVDEMAGKICL